ncbi:MAG: TerD family protein [Microscillaceae bacterium]|nr:TerD family protein [Microscillaceae bacterium]MDW8459828.1 TerD family protein [Cytophagales bacterium]
MNTIDDKSKGIELEKGNAVTLEKQGKKLENIYVGLNWGCITRKSLFGLVSQKETVDLDGSVAMYDKQNRLVDIVYYHNLKSKDGAVRHSGDDRTGDVFGDDNLDNEIIQVKLSQVSPNIHQIVFFLNSYKGHDFRQIPYSKIRIFEGESPRHITEIFATFNLSAEEQFKKKVAMILGKLVRKDDNSWEFKAIGEAGNKTKIDDTLKEIAQRFL